MNRSFLDVFMRHRGRLPQPDPQQKPVPVKLTPELLDWVQRQASKEEIAAGIREIGETGGSRLAEVIQQLKSDQSIL